MPLGIARLNTLGRIISAAPSPSVIYRYGNFVEGYNGASISTAQNKVGTSSIYLDGNDFLMVRSPSNNIVLSGDFTVETWFRLPGGNPTIGAFFWFNPFLLYQSGSNFYLWNGSGNVAATSSVSITSNTWYHLALVRSNGNVSFYFNGTLIGGPTNYTATITANDDNKYIGNYQNSYYFNVYFDEYRISDTARYTANFTPSTSAFTNDENTLLLLHGEGTNGSITFYDDTDIRYPVSVQTVGNAQISTAQSKIGSSSAAFDGSGDYLQLTNLTPSNVFTYELWIRFNTLPGNNSWQMLVTSSGNYYFGVYNNNGTREYQCVINGVGRSFTAQALTTNTWIHIALIQDGTTCKLYENGVLQTASGSNLSTTVSLFSSSPILGIYTNNSLPFDGYMDEIRYSRTVRYTSNFTPSTTAFENDADTLMLLHCEGANASTQFTDDNGGYVFPKTVTRAGNAQVSTAQSKFGTGSALFDGSGDYLTVDGTINIGTGDFTIETWARHLAVNTNQMYLDSRPSNQNGAYPGVFFLGANSRPYYYFNTDTRITADAAMSTNTWYHVAIVRSSGVTRMYIDGNVQSTTYTNSDSIAFSYATIGASNDSSRIQSINGYLDEFRISNTARYTTNFTPSASAFTYDANTLLLIHADGYNGYTIFKDDKGQTITIPNRLAAELTANGNIQVSTAQKKFGTGSILGDGTDDTITTPYKSVYDISSNNNWTVECWLRPNSVASIYGIANCLVYGTDSQGWQLCTNGTNVQFLDANNGFTSLITSGVTLAVDTWYHIALVRNGSDLNIYIDGVSRASVNNYTSKGATSGPLRIGEGSSTQGNYWAYVGGRTLNGYMDEFRISNTSRYTGTFTPPTTAFTNDLNTVLLIHGDGTNGSTTFTDDNA